jgi:formylglycine-generating enzyme required for sulfatase activity
MSNWIAILVILPVAAFSNGLEINGLSLLAPTSVSASISWENSWRYADSVSPANHDAVWIFCKGKTAASGTWEHIDLAAASVDGTAMTIELAEGGTGAMLHRNSPGEGSLQNLSLEFFLDVVSLSGFSELRLFGIEMVYVPEGSFYAGDSVSTNTLIKYSSNKPYYIENENDIIVGNSGDLLWSAADFPPAGDIPSSWPKGYDAFYCMKYEISQQQYADFLNTTDPGQQAANELNTVIQAPCFTGDHIDGERNFITYINGLYGCDANGNGILNETDDGMETACNFLTWSNLGAYLDWSGLRPMTELEFEKASRGPAYPVPLEFAWGTVDHINTTDLRDANTRTEHAADTVPEGSGLANYGYCQPSGPMRCGFAGWNSDSRSRSGASYYGIMELSGNLWELCVPMSADGLLFNGEHGDGSLTPDGRADAADWISGGHRGGGWNSGILDGFRDLAVSDRFFIYLDPDNQARGTAGGRGVLSENRLR